MTKNVTVVHSMDWISVDEALPIGDAMVFMYSIANNEFSYGHFTFQRGDVKVTHWYPLIPPNDKALVVVDCIHRNAQ